MSVHLILTVVWLLLQSIVKKLVEHGEIWKLIQIGIRIGNSNEESASWKLKNLLCSFNTLSKRSNKWLCNKGLIEFPNISPSIDISSNQIMKMDTCERITFVIIPEDSFIDDHQWYNLFFSDDHLISCTNIGFTSNKQFSLERLFWCSRKVNIEKRHPTLSSRYLFGWLWCGRRRRLHQE